jgi:hypothetical protein
MDKTGTLALFLGLIWLSACGPEDREFLADPAAADPTGAGGSTGANGETTASGVGGASSASAASVSGASSSGSGVGGREATTPIFRMDCEDAPLDCGWGYAPEESPYYTLAHVEDGGPGGEDVVEFDHTPQPEGAPQVQYYCGWGRELDTVPSQGATRYVRFWFKPLTPIRWSGTGDVWGDKFFILGDGNGETTRVICNLRDDFWASGTGQDMLINCARNIDGAPSHAGGATLLPDQWNFVQIEVRSSSTPTAEDARIAMWYNTNDYDSPTSQSTGGFALETWGWSNINLGRYVGTGLAYDGHMNYQVGGFEFDDEFDPSWSP